MMNSIGEFYADVVLNHLLRHTLSVVRHSLQTNALTKVLSDGKRRWFNDTGKGRYL